MVNILTNIGEEWYSETNINGATVTVALYSDTNDALTDSSTLAAITEPSGTNYARQSSTVTTVQIGSDYGIQNDSSMTFDTSDSSMTVDAAALIVNFQSDTVNGDGSAQDHLVAAGDLSQSRDLSSVDEVNISAGDVQVSID